jgi:hypothetical protein
MMKLLMGLMLLMTATAASAEWTVAGENEDITLYVDRATIRRNGNFVKMWSLVDYKKAKVSGGKSSLSQRRQQEYDCTEENLRSLAQTYSSGQMGSGAVTYNDSDTDKWAPIAPGSVGETMWKIACGKE